MTWKTWDNNNWTIIIIIIIIILSGCKLLELYIDTIIKKSIWCTEITLSSIIQLCFMMLEYVCKISIAKQPNVLNNPGDRQGNSYIHRSYIPWGFISEVFIGFLVES